MQFFAVPPDQRLVIEFTTIEAAVPAGQIAFLGTLLASADGAGQQMRFPLQPFPDNSTTHDSFGTAQLTRVNVSAGVIVAVTRSATTGTGIVNVALSGYLVDAP